MPSVRRIPAFLSQLLIAFLFAGALLAGAQAREPVTEPLDLRYDLYLGGITVAEFALRYAPDGEEWRSDLSARTVGLFDSLVGFRGEATSEGFKTNGTVRPASYRYETSSKRVSRLERVRFDPATLTAVEVETQKRGVPNQTEVPKDLWRGVIDPLTALIQARQQLAEAEPRVGSRFTLPVFDGRRRYDMQVNVVGRDQMRRVAGFEGPALRLDLELQPLAGFDRDEDDDRPDYAGLKIRLLLSDDERLVPLRVASRTTPITVALVLTQDCSRASAGCAPQ